MDVSSTPSTFIREMLTGKELYGETVPINEGKFEMTFNIKGLKSAIKTLEACPWK